MIVKSLRHGVVRDKETDQGGTSYPAVEQIGDSKSHRWDVL